jgi:site-specific DNA-methyltransferase (adenine-specific)
MTDTPILAGDARVVLPEAFVADVLIVDPPYRAHVHEKARSQDQSVDGNVRHNDFGFVSLTEELRLWICQLAARTKRWSLIYTDVESVAKWKETLELAGATYIRTLPWVRWSMPCLAGDRPPQGFECIVVAYGSGKGRKHWNGAGNLTHLAQALEDWVSVDELLSQAADGDLYALTHLTHLALRGNGKHKTEKPLDQLLDLVSWFSDPGETIVDPCAGSGTTGLAAKILGRNFVGCELNTEWWEKGNERIRACNVGDLPGSLSSRDSERFLRWVVTTEKEKSDSVSRKQNTERVRKRLADKKAFLSLVPSTEVDVPVVRAEDYVRSTRGFALPDKVDGSLASSLVKEKTMTIPTVWTETYQRCLADTQPKAPKTSAAERTIPMFSPPSMPKKWSVAYERSILELAPPLSATLLAKLAEKKKNGVEASDAHGGDVDNEDEDFVAPPKDDSESGFTQPDGTLISVQSTTPSSGVLTITGVQQHVTVSTPETHSVITPAITGNIPPHILAELGMHPSLVDEPVRNRALVVARHTGWKDDWAFLQENAPTGFFARVLKEMNMIPGERLSVLAEAACARGLHVTALDVASWSLIQRNAARGYIEQGVDWPEWFTDKYGTMRANECAACERGDERPFTHLCEKGRSLGEEKQMEAAPPLPQVARRGRPPGVKNKAPKTWKAAYTRVMADLGVS